MQEVITDWTVNSHSGLVSVMYFQDSSPIGTIRSSIQTLYTSIQGLLSNAVTWTIRTTGRSMDEATGNLQGVWGEAAARTGAGTAVQATVADTSQLLIRWKTGEIVNSRFVQGRTFIPGYTQTGIIAGNVASSTITTVNAAAQTFADAPNGFGIWARPFKQGETPPHPDARNGSLHPVSIGTCWTEMAVLRRRRL